MDGFPGIPKEGMERMLGNMLRQLPDDGLVDLTRKLLAECQRRDLDESKLVVTSGDS